MMHVRPCMMHDDADDDDSGGLVVIVAIMIEMNGAHYDDSGDDYDYDDDNSYESRGQKKLELDDKKDKRTRIKDTMRTKDKN